MQIFISYRREDTAGRAGRLFDALVGRFGVRDVFQDVTAISPGTDFEQAIAAAIERCDVALVVIGTEWATLAGPGGRRLDAPDDYVRREVAAALASDKPVVPVLVDGAAMPSTEQLPEELRPLARRQAVTIRDDTWHQDIDALTRRLQHDDVVVPERRPTPRLIAGAAGLALAILAVVVALWLWLAHDGSDVGSDGASGDTITGCPAPSSAWQQIPIAGAASTTADADGAQLLFTVRSTALDREASQLYVDVEVRNVSDPASSTVPYYNESLIRTVSVDGLARGRAWCLTVEGDPNLHPGQRAIGLVGFDVDEDPTGRPLALALLSGAPQIQLTP